MARAKTTVTYNFYLEADSKAELVEATEVLADELDGIPDNIIDYLTHPGNYDLELKHKHRHTEVSIEAGDDEEDEEED